MPEREVMRFRADEETVRYIEDLAKDEDIGCKSEAIRYLLRLAQFTISIAKNEELKKFLIPSIRSQGGKT